MRAPPSPRASRPTAIKHLVRDVLALGEQLSPGRPFVLVAHDWGASVAYATAIAAPSRIAKLVVINGVHPGPFQRALIEDEAQRQASAYMHYLRAPEAEERLSANNFEKLLGMLTRFGPQPWLTPEKRAGYLEAWSPAGRADRHAQLVSRHAAAWCRRRARRSTRRRCRSSIRRSSGCACRISSIWGMDDRALLPVSRATLADYCDDLTVREIAGADHWVVHQKTDEVIGLIREFPRCLRSSRHLLPGSSAQRASMP